MERTTRHIHLLKALLTGALITAMCACSDNDDDNRNVNPTIYDIAQLQLTPEQPASFLLYSRENTPPTTLLPTNLPTLPSDALSGNSYMIGYRVMAQPLPYTMQVELTTCSLINNSDIKLIAPDKLNGWDANPVWVVSVWPAGDKVNMHVLLEYDAQPRLFALVVDESTLSDPFPTAYLFHQRRTDTPGYQKKYYAAFNCEPLWQTQGVEGLIIKVNNSNNPSLNEFRIYKPTE